MRWLIVLQRKIKQGREMGGWQGMDSMARANLPERDPKAAADVIQGGIMQVSTPAEVVG